MATLWVEYGYTMGRVWVGSASWYSRLCGRLLCAAELSDRRIGGILWAIELFLGTTSTYVCNSAAFVMISCPYQNARFMNICSLATEHMFSGD